GCRARPVRLPWLGNGRLAREVRRRHGGGSLKGASFSGRARDRHWSPGRSAAGGTASPPIVPPTPRRRGARPGSAPVVATTAAHSWRSVIRAPGPASAGRLTYHPIRQSYHG